MSKKVKNVLITSIVVVIGIIAVAAALHIHNEPAEKQPVEVTEAAEEEIILELLQEKEERYKINIFLSNFSEQWFNEYNWYRNEDIYEKFDIEDASVAQLIYFSYFWHRLNSWESFELMNNMEALSFEKINEKLYRYFGVTLTEEEFKNSGLQILENNLLMPCADGESYPNFTVANEIIEIEDQTYQVNFKIYSLEEASTGGNRVTDKNWYSLTEEEAAQFYNHLSYYKSGCAIIKPYKENGVDSYHLVSYWLDGQVE